MVTRRRKRRNMKTLIGRQSPWGIVDGEDILIDGVAWVNTPSHGGVKLSRQMNAKIPRHLRAPGGWYEEDEHWLIPVIFLHKDGAFTDAEYVNAIKNLLPDEYEKLFPNGYDGTQNVVFE